MILAGCLALFVVLNQLFAASASTTVTIKAERDGQPQTQEFHGVNYPTVGRIRKMFAGAAAGLAVCDKNGKELAGGQSLTKETLSNVQTTTFGQHVTGTLETLFVDIKNMLSGKVYSFTVCQQSTWGELLDRLKLAGEEFDPQRLPPAAKLDQIIPQQYMTPNTDIIELYKPATVPLTLSYADKDSKLASIKVAIATGGHDVEALRETLVSLLPTEVANVPLCGKDGKAIQGRFYLNNLAEGEPKGTHQSNAGFLTVQCPDIASPRVLAVCPKTDPTEAVEAIRTFCGIHPDATVELLKDGVSVTNGPLPIDAKINLDAVINVVVTKPAPGENHAVVKGGEERTWAFTVPGLPGITVKPNVVFLCASIFLILLGGGLHLATKDNRNQKFKMAV